MRNKFYSILFSLKKIKFNSLPVKPYFESIAIKNLISSDEIANAVVEAKLAYATVATMVLVKDMVEIRVILENRKTFSEAVPFSLLEHIFLSH